MCVKLTQCMTAMPARRAPLRCSSPCGIKGLNQPSINISASSCMGRMLECWNLGIQNDLWAKIEAVRGLTLRV